MPAGCTLLFLGNTMQNTTRRYKKCVVREGLKDYIYNKFRIIHILMSCCNSLYYILLSINIDWNLAALHASDKIDFDHGYSLWWYIKVLYKVHSLNDISVSRKFFLRRKNVLSKNNLDTTDEKYKARDYGSWPTYDYHFS